ncbi:poly(R)-hydroxyalkanoic acid synthase subunit PhaE [Nitrincola alkalilacustris]|uniref:poly(R)-hydroxyalkanoic acid synthase subunit PhaE n=1 Tax=Nitrincola alkalilacustris TaxID=1571224 RepID=UPI00124C0E28|nr:poly(R)-hydroxyalkanoic acid synthase subunit PhaE [Nitrincola alkalilacustris]
MDNDLLELMRRWLNRPADVTAATDDPDRKAEPEGDADWQTLLQKLQSQGWSQLPQQQAEVLSLLTRQSSEFTRFAEQLLASLNEKSAELSFAPFFTQFHDHIRRLTNEWLVQRWQLPEQLGSLLRTHSFQDDLLFDNPFINGLKSLLENPVVGTTHQQQSAIKKGVALLLEYQHALSDYSQHYSRINTEALEQMMHEVNQSDSEISTLHELHTLWVNCYESVYAKAISADQYQRAHGRISNAVMQLRKFMQDQRDVQLNAVGLATRQGLNTALERQHKMRKQMKQVRKELNELAVLREEVALLRKEVQQLRKDKSSKPSTDRDTSA